MPGISQSESLSVALPIENSPPGIQTIPGGADDGDVALGTVGAKEEDSATSGTLVGDGAATGCRDNTGRSAYTLNEAAITKPSIRNQPTYDRRIREEFFVRFIAVTFRKQKHVSNRSSC
jgi:hypothetical protein